MGLVEDVEIGAAEVAAGVAALPLVALQNIATLGLLVFVSLGLIGTRALLLELSPTIAKHAKGFATVLNIAIDTLQVFVIAIHEVVSVITNAIRHLLGKHTHRYYPHFVKDPVSTEEIRSFFSSLPSRCAARSGKQTRLSVAARNPPITSFTGGNIHFKYISNTNVRTHSR